MAVGVYSTMTVYTAVAAVQPRPYTVYSRGHIIYIYMAAAVNTAAVVYTAAAVNTATAVYTVAHNLKKFQNG